MFLQTVVLPFCIHTTIPTNTTKRLRDFFCPEIMFFIVSRGYMIFFCSERLHDFFLSREVACCFCPERLHDFFVLKGYVIVFVPKGYVFFLS